MNDNNKTKSTNQNVKPNQNKDLSGSQTGTQVSNPGMNSGQRTPQSSPGKMGGTSNSTKAGKNVDLDQSDRVSQRDTGGGSDIDDTDASVDGADSVDGEHDTFTPGRQGTSGGRQSKTSEKDESSGGR